MGIEDNFGSRGGTANYICVLPGVCISDGAKALADEHRAYWLMKAIGTHLPKVDDTFAVARLMYKGSKWELVISDDVPPNEKYASQEIPFSDFPKKGVKLYLGPIQDGWLIYVPNER